jgi:hypothetical protein
MNSLPYVYNNHHVPSTPQTPPLTAPWPSHLVYGFSTLAERPLAASTDHMHRLPPPTAHQYHRWQLLPFPHSTIALAADPPGSSERTHQRVCLRVTYAPAPSYVGRRTSYTLSLLRGACRA